MRIRECWSEHQNESKFKLGDLFYDVEHVRDVIFYKTDT